MDEMHVTFVFTNALHSFRPSKNTHDDLDKTIPSVR